ncbi:hypothetical protein AYL99_11934 [Fonsecaea erecta]|uniref:Uncharacterized protein n=1 Tax=Fonsecaea erecta TaxID=1367422 RepID=A0A178Z2A7_9EURO|nr:hypothetical protein AYL99_11934 [Fonsecaea erecta]OAP53912.1 hypothetical protein AYL99_11934 [Fonsecaea erecta]
MLFRTHQIRGFFDEVACRYCFRFAQQDEEKQKGPDSSTRTFADDVNGTRDLEDSVQMFWEDAATSTFNSFVEIARAMALIGLPTPNEKALPLHHCLRNALRFKKLPRNRDALPCSVLSRSSRHPHHPRPEYIMQLGR